MSDTTSKQDLSIVIEKFLNEYNSKLLSSPRTFEEEEKVPKKKVTPFLNLPRLKAKDSCFIAPNESKQVIH